ncbi:MAG: hypothetical protein JW699_07340 [Chitinispirillaceae bacterium]|nr:hypothetical protein [Chitinispirillaceae bacterium]
MKTNISKEAGMKIWTMAVIAVALMSTGCGITIVESDGRYRDGGYSQAYVDTYISLPGEVKDLIAPAAEGYFTPSLSRYSDYLYPRDLPYNPYDLPCYVRADFNDDGYHDYAFLFSAEEWAYGNWYLTTRLIVVLSTWDGWEIGADEVLGTVYADASVPLEEYWSIFRLSAGSHTFVTERDDMTITKTVTIDRDAFYLASLDPDEESLFYADGGYVYKMSPDAPLAKKQALAKSAGDTKRVIPFSKEVEGRVRPVK